MSMSSENIANRLAIIMSVSSLFIAPPKRFDNSTTDWNDIMEIPALVMHHLGHFYYHFTNVHMSYAVLMGRCLMVVPVPLGPPPGLEDGCRI